MSTPFLDFLIVCVARCSLPSGSARRYKGGRRGTYREQHEAGSIRAFIPRAVRFGEGADADASILAP